VLGNREQHLAAAQRITHCGSWELDLANLTDVNQNPLRWSDEVFRIFGHEPGAIEVTNENFFAAVHPDDRAKIGAAVAAAIENGTMYSIDHRIVRPDGEVRIVHEQSEIQYDDQRRPVLMIGTVQDVTEQRAIEAQLAFADRLTSIGTMAAGIVHEINNPLVAVISNLDLVARLLPDNAPARVREALAHAMEGAGRVRELARDVRVYARPDDPRAARIDVRPVLDSALRMARHELIPRARVFTEYHPVPLVEGSEAGLAQVFLNLLRNAAQAIAPGDADGQAVHVRCRTRDDGWLVIEVADTGTGIAPDLQSRVFTPFFTTRPAGVGTGLGLSICHRIVTDLGGHITFESEVGKGTVFRIALPGVDNR
jgi:PAS domain S-box-containing protein